MAIAYGKQYSEFWVNILFDHKTATIGNGTHMTFIALTKEAVHAFYEAALASGGTDEGESGGREDYGKPYYGFFVRDLDENKIEAAFWNEQMEQT